MENTNDANTINHITRGLLKACSVPGLVTALSMHYLASIHSSVRYYSSNEDTRFRDAS